MKILEKFINSLMFMLITSTMIYFLWRWCAVSEWLKIPEIPGSVAVFISSFMLGPKKEKKDE